MCGEMMGCGSTRYASSSASSPSLSLPPPCKVFIVDLSVRQQSKWLLSVYSVLAY